MTKVNEKSLGGWVGGFATFFFYVGLLMAYLRTVEAMSMFAPSSIFGWEDESVKWLWAGLTGLLVEGLVSLGFHALWDTKKDDPTRYTAIIMAIAGIAFSASMNALDVGRNEGWLIISEDSPLTFVFRVVVIGVPFVVPAMLGVLLATDKANPDKDQRPNGGQPQGQRQPSNFKPEFDVREQNGFRNMGAGSPPAHNYPSRSDFRPEQRPNQGGRPDEQRPRPPIPHGSEPLPKRDAVKDDEMARYGLGNKPTDRVYENSRTPELNVRSSNGNGHNRPE